MNTVDSSASPSDRRVRVPKTAELVAARLRREIVFGQLVEGDPLASETELMSDFGVSRPTLREAFRILESEGLISVMRGMKGGARVHSPSAEIAARYTGWVLQFKKTSLMEIYAAGVVIEASCAAHLARHRTKSDLVQLKKSIERARSAVETHDPATESRLLVKAHHEFQQLVVELAGNTALQVLASMIDTILDKADAEYAEMTHANVGIHGLWKLAGDSQAKLVEYIEAGDAAGAERHWRAYLQAAADRVVSGLGSKSVLEIME